MIFMLLPIMSIAQDTLQSEKSYNLEEIVITSDKLDTKLVDVSTKVEILNRKQIEKINGNRISEILLEYKKINNI